jgi:hypothetical protein
MAAAEQALHTAIIWGQSGVTHEKLVKVPLDILKLGNATEQSSVIEMLIELVRYLNLDLDRMRSPVTAEKYRWLSHRAYVQRGSSLHLSRSIRRLHSGNSGWAPGYTPIPSTLRPRRLAALH